MRIRLESESGELQDQLDLPWNKPRDIVCFKGNFFVLAGHKISGVIYRPATCCILTDQPERIVADATPAALRAVREADESFSSRHSGERRYGGHALPGRFRGGGPTRREHE